METDEQHGRSFEALRALVDEVGAAIEGRGAASLGHVGHARALAAIEHARRGLARWSRMVAGPSPGPAPARARPDSLEGSIHRMVRGGDAGPRVGRIDEPFQGAVDETPDDTLENTLDAREIALERDAVLRLMLWHAMSGWDARCARGSSGPRRGGHWLKALGATATQLPPGLMPTPEFSEKGHRQGFFVPYLGEVLARVGTLLETIDPPSPAPIVPTGADGSLLLAERWSRPWTDAAVIAYADCLMRRAFPRYDKAGMPADRRQLDILRDSLWQSPSWPPEFHPRPGMAVIPTKGHYVHLDLWTQPVLAQLLQSDRERWQQPRVDGRWQRARIPVHRLSGDSAPEADSGPRAFNPRGLRIEMIYQCALLDRLSALGAGGALAATPPMEETTMSPQARGAEEQQVEIAIPGYCPGQQINLRLVVQWRPPRPVAPRWSGPAAPDDIDRDERALLERLVADARVQARERAATIGLQTLEAEPLAWWAAPDDAPLGPEGSARLGHIDLWNALAADAQWCDFAAVGRQGGQWHPLPLRMAEDTLEGAPRMALLADADISLDGRPAALAQLKARLGRPDCRLWLARTDGPGAFVTLGIDFDAP